jgi:hypothetical protein
MIYIFNMNSCTSIALLVLLVVFIMLLCYNCSSFSSGQGPLEILKHIPMETETNSGYVRHV